MRRPPENHAPVDAMRVADRTPALSSMPHQERRGDREPQPYQEVATGERGRRRDTGLQLATSLRMARGPSVEQDHRRGARCHHRDHHDPPHQEHDDPVAGRPRTGDA